MSEFDAFEDIIKNGNLEGLEDSGRNLVIVSVKSVHETIASLTLTASMLTDFIIEYFKAIGAGEEPPALSAEAAAALTTMSIAAETFCDEVSICSECDDDDYQR